MYGKVFDSMFDGTLASRGPWQALVTFQQLIVLANPDGIVDMTADAISRRTSIPLEIIELGIAELLKPDARSRTPDEDGRRIVLIDDHRDWGWQIVNHAKYQSMRNVAERREYLRVAQAERRARLKAEALSTPVNSVNSVSAKINTSTPTDTDASTDASTDVFGGQAPPNPPAPAALSGKPPRKRASKPAGESKSAETWARYAEAYAARYGAQPVRNARVNGQLAQLVVRLGADEAPAVAAFYVQTRTSLYVAAKHCTDLLLRDAEKLRTEWATGNVTYQRDAHEADRLGSTGAMWDRVGEKLRAKGIV